MRERTLVTVLAFSIALVPACKKSSGAASADDGGAAAAAPSGAAGSSTASLGSGFEGEITMHTTSVHGPPQDLTFLVKGGKLRLDVPAHHGETAHVIVDPAAHKTLTILDTQKMYMELDRPPGAPAAGMPSAAAKVTKTGKHETIAGMDCEDWEVVESTGKRSAACVAHGIPFFDYASASPMAAGPQRAWIEELRSEQAFPLKAVETDTTGREISRMEVTKIEKKSLDDALFAVPPGYKTMTIPHFGSLPMPVAPAHK